MAPVIWPPAHTDGTESRRRDGRLDLPDVRYLLAASAKIKIRFRTLLVIYRLIIASIQERLLREHMEDRKTMDFYMQILS